MRVVDRGHAMGVAVLRIAVGIVFLWAGLEKFFGASAPGWTAAGFLKGATAGTLSWPFVSGTPAQGTVYNPTHDVWVSLAGNVQAMAVIDTLVVFGETAIGIALVLGFMTRFASIMGTLMMLFFFVAAWQFSTGIVNQHLTYAVVVAFIGYIGAGNYYGLDATVARNMSPALRKWIFSGEDVTPVTA